MPTYVYECKECAHRFEIFQSFSATPLDTCPSCSEVALRKVLFPAGVVFKGAGFYVNDSRGPRPKTSAKGAESEGNGAKKSGEKKTDEKTRASNGSPRGKKPAKSGTEKS